MKNFLLVFIISILLNACSAQDTAHYKVLSSSNYALALAQDKSAQLIDVRTPEEYEEGHLENAVNINIKDSNFIELVKKLNKEKPVYVYCRSGVRSRKAGAELEKLGFKQIFDLDGGILSWTGKTVK
ncbi:MAG TPA: rhodanese-like domain-containing protein [Chitinophagaceae bacterium]|nr:rhodanese-like domain-containing protein [Chitinophagaceae bacterium]MCC6635374.1 rhodanese-like domain-containing protein [Chitinophagaceae bacterium]HMZ45863.1 rhodanese-like domain-containing protein [Chitinophagaceae bacterium]HNE92489.1 rhodanese-like domain-containing protein [Chitinophagaceae bacterium]HNF29429.1 rhodanese-like domain-containing protein [Chitinophagaceae bacterium]